MGRYSCNHQTAAGSDLGLINLAGSAAVRVTLYDVIIGSDSSFGAFAAYYGNIPHIVFNKKSMDWAYYRNNQKYFQNKYCTLVHF